MRECVLILVLHGDTTFEYDHGPGGPAGLEFDVQLKFRARARSRGVASIGATRRDEDERSRD
jgi:hypothetical protein